MDYMLMVFYGTEGTSYYRLSDNDMRAIIEEANGDDTLFEHAAWVLYHCGYLELDCTIVQIKGELIRFELQLG